MVNQRPFILKTAMLDYQPSGVQQPRPDRDLFFGLEKEGTVASGEVLETPRLEGASGCSIWELTGYDGGLWTPDKAVKIIGVQQSALHQQWFRATRWEAVLPVLYSLAEKPTGTSEAP